ncbi:hypothetical protein WG907_05285 [Sphingobium sp. AN558]|uniref:hypothetical protein n=1 Tax=Sphingobium sp. AN558 TaxID=3133442 RepID=UPI0030C1F339
MAFTDWSTNPNDNTSIAGINIGENCPAGNINNALREMMAQLAQWRPVAGYQPASETLSSLTAMTGTANAFPAFNASGDIELAGITSYMRGVLNSVDPTEAAAAIGAIVLAGATLGNPGHVRFKIGPSTFFQVAWGTFSIGPNSGGNTLYSTPFQNVSFPVMSGTGLVSAAQRNTPAVVSGSAATNGFSFFNAESYTISGYYIAVGF